MWIFYLILCIASSIFWRMGGAAGYDKLWRRIGSSACMILILFSTPVTWDLVFASGLIIWGCTSYFGWLTPGDKKERWFNYLLAASITEGAALLIHFNWILAGIALFFALFCSIGKVLIDNSDVNSKDVLSELFYGFFICLGIAILRTAMLGK